MGSLDSIHRLSIIHNRLVGPFVTINYYKMFYNFETTQGGGSTVRQHLEEHLAYFDGMCDNFRWFDCGNKNVMLHLQEEP